MPVNYNILLVEDSPDSAMLVNHFLGASKTALFRVAAATTLRAAVDALGRERFDAVLLDLNLPDSRGLETFARVRELAGGAAIVILTAVEDEAVATRAIGQGAADYLIKGEVGGEGLSRRIRFAIERSRAAPAAPEAPPTGRVVVVTGARGGAGVSTAALNLAAALTRRGRKVALVELRPHGGALAAMLNVTPALTIESVTELGGPHALESVWLKLPFGTHLLAAPAALDGSGTWDESAVAALLSRVAGVADRVLVDASMLLPHLLKTAAARAFFTLLVVEREPLAIQMAGRMTGSLAAWSDRTNSLGAVLVNHVPFLDSAPLPAIRAELNCGIIGVVPPAREALQSFRRQGPIVLAQRQSPVAVAFEDVAARLEHEPVQFLAG